MPWRIALARSMYSFSILIKLRGSKMRMLVVEENYKRWGGKWCGELVVISFSCRAMWTSDRLKGIAANYMQWPLGGRDRFLPMSDGRPRLAICRELCWP